MDTDPRIHRVRYIVLHHNGVPGRTVDDIRRTHRAKGWSDTGYHYVIHEDGSVHPGRPLLRANGRINSGAHVEGLNVRTIGVCLIGNGNKRPFLPEQMLALRSLVGALQAQFGVPASRVIGHRETRALVAPDVATSKECPGRLFDLEAFRASLSTPLAQA